MKLFGGHHEGKTEEQGEEPQTMKGEDHQFFITNVHNTLNKEIASLIGKSETSATGSEGMVQETPEPAPSVGTEPERGEEAEEKDQDLPRERVEMDESEISMVIDSIDMKDFSHLVQTIWTSGNAPITFRNTLKIMNAPGREKYNEMFQSIERATSHIHIEYSVIKDRSLNSQLVELLARKAAAGVSVRLLYQGKHGGFNRKIKKKWSTVPVNYHPLPSHSKGKKLLKRVSQSHSKSARRNFVIVDGQCGFVGEMNFSDDQFSNDKEAFLQIRGDSINILQGLFCDDWEEATGQSLKEYQQYPSSFYPEAQHEETDRIIPMQTLITKPNISQQSSITFTGDVLPSLIQSAHHSVYIGLPSFHPDDELLKVLKEAANADKDVRLLVQGTKEFPGVHGKAHPIKEEVVDDLLQSKVKIHRYEQGLLRSKMIIVDHRISIIGTIGVNSKPQETSTEVNNIIYDERTAEELENVFWADTLGGEEARLPPQNAPTSTTPDVPQSEEKEREETPEQRPQAPEASGSHPQELEEGRRGGEQEEIGETQGEQQRETQQEEEQQRETETREQEGRETQDTKKKKRGIISRIFKKKKKSQA